MDGTVGRSSRSLPVGIKIGKTALADLAMTAPIRVFRLNTEALWGSWWVDSDSWRLIAKNELAAASCDLAGERRKFRSDTAIGS